MGISSSSSFNLARFPVTIKLNRRTFFARVSVDNNSAGMRGSVEAEEGDEPSSSNSLVYNDEDGEEATRRREGRRGQEGSGSFLPQSIVIIAIKQSLAAKPGDKFLDSGQAALIFRLGSVVASPPPWLMNADTFTGEFA